MNEGRFSPMIIPFVIGAAIAGLGRTRRDELALAIGAGMIIGIISGMSFLPLVYPFYSVTNSQITTPEMVFIDTFFLSPDFVKWRVGVPFLWMSPTIILLFVPLGIVGSSLGLLLGLRVLGKKDDRIWLNDDQSL
jgi:hypothetical protein